MTATPAWSRATPATASPPSWPPPKLAGLGGRRAITATVAAYEAFCRLGDAATLRYRGYDHVTNGCVASVLGAARSLGLSEEQTHQALNLGIAPNIALGQTRGGVLSHWKGCAYANASRNAVFATMLAQRGADRAGADL